MTDKRKDIQIFMMCHRSVEYGLIDNEIITPIQCGADVFDNNICELKDNTGDNISKYNEFFLEDTAIYWIWKNVKDAKYKGQMQYRRRLDLFPYTDYDRLFKDYDAIIAKPLDLYETFGIYGDTVEKQYALAHCDDDLKLIGRIIDEKYPEYSEDYDRYIRKGRYIFYSNGWILKAEDYDKYCEFLFGILNEWIERRSICTIDELKRYVDTCIKTGEITCSTMEQNWRNDYEHALKYQMRIGGSLAERIFTLYAYHNFKNIFYVDYIKPENLMI